MKSYTGRGRRATLIPNLGTRIERKKERKLISLKYVLTEEQKTVLYTVTNRHTNTTSLSKASSPGTVKYQTMNATRYLQINGGILRVRC